MRARPDGGDHRAPRDERVRRQSLEVLEPADPFSGTGLRTVRSSYTIEYWDHGRRLEVREPN
ncbi:MAG: hypothetical protein AAB284_07995 [Chloroflexota bacterium]